MNGKLPQSIEKFEAAENSGQVCLSRLFRDHNGRMLLAWTTKNPMLRNEGEVVLQEELDKFVIEGDAEAFLYSVGEP